MAIQDLFNGITEDADSRIDAAKKEHSERIAELKSSHEHALSKNLHSMKQQSEQKKMQMTQRAKSQASLLRRHALLRKKQQMMEKVYADTIEKLQHLPQEKLEIFLKKCLDRIDAKGIIHPAKSHQDLLKKIVDSGKFELGTPVKASGGFVFSSKTELHDYTFEFMVKELLRSSTELTTSHSLFSHS